MIPMTSPLDPMLEGFYTTKYNINRSIITNAEHPNAATQKVSRQQTEKQQVDVRPAPGANSRVLTTKVNTQSTVHRVNHESLKNPSLERYLIDLLLGAKHGHKPDRFHAPSLCRTDFVL
ncbi:hypothetical protein EVAR_57797_1 [Eumeta japonica]|uniref:Uncharacterized protein n=1 Tax=Eumeta variegata TaxID=151549 RepID=A0A4C1Y8W8_EUMVA|nr:hypothetical protein EVAR_57797_1 [Eumeta japonica]